MKRVGPRIDGLYDAEVRQWRAAWQRFIDAIWQKLNNEELDAYVDLTELAEGDPIWPDVESASAKLCAELGVGVEMDGGPIADFFHAFDAYCPVDLDAPDLSRWPSGVPSPPEAMEAPSFYELQRLCRERHYPTEAERLAMGHFLGGLAIAETCKHYAR